jgi:hypothetical protein
VNRFLVTAKKHTPAGKPVTMARIIRTYADADFAAWKALTARKDRGTPFLGEAIRVTPLIGPLMDHGKPVEFVYNPDTQELVRSSPT